MFRKPNCKIIVVFFICLIVGAYITVKATTNFVQLVLGDLKLIFQDQTF